MVPFSLILSGSLDRVCFVGRRPCVDADRSRLRASDSVRRTLWNRGFHRARRMGQPGCSLGTTKNFPSQAKSRRLNNLFSSVKKRFAFLIWFEFEYHPDGDESIFCLWITRQDFTAFNKSQILIELRLEHCLMLYAIRPIEVIADGKNYVTRILVHADYVDNIKLLNRHFLSSMLWLGFFGTV